MTRLGTRSARLLAGTIFAVVAVAALAACGGGSSPAQRRAQSQTLQAARTLTGRLRTDRLVSSKGIVTSYGKCGAGATHVQYVASQPLEPLGGTLPQAQLSAQLVTEMSGLGWKLTREPRAARDTIFYKMAGHRLTGELYVNDSGLGLNANLFVYSACFDAGSGAAGLLKAESTYPAPTPSAS